MNKKIWAYFKIAGKFATSKKDKREFMLGAVGIRKDGTMVNSLNSPTWEPAREAHAEYKLTRKLGFDAPEVYIARVRKKDGKFANAKPCASCRKILSTRRVKRVYYTISDSEYGIWYP